VPGSFTPISRLGLLLGDSAGGFPRSLTLDLPTGTVLGALCSLDLGGDGDPDFVGSVLYTNGVRVIRNQSRFGTGCESAGIGVPAFGATSTNIGSATFQSLLGNALPFATAVFGLSRAASLNSSSCQIAIDLNPQNLLLPFGTIGYSVTDAQGNATISLSIPAEPSLIGTTLYGQWGVIDPLAAGGLALSRAGKFIIW
jgi:hypothetical protein